MTNSPIKMGIIGAGNMGGAFAKALSQVTDCFDSVRPDLLLDGLRMLYAEYRAGKNSSL